jgi:hypothetical protein
MNRINSINCDDYDMDYYDTKNEVLYGFYDGGDDDRCYGQRGTVKWMMTQDFKLLGIEKVLRCGGKKNCFRAQRYRRLMCFQKKWKPALNGVRRETLIK